MFHQDKIKSGQIHGDRKQNGGYQKVGERGNGEWEFDGYSFRDENILEMDGALQWEHNVM